MRSRRSLFEGWYWSIELVFIYLTISIILLTLILALPTTGTSGLLLLQQFF